ncbi:hypothetical protein MACH09_41850 [Vibrio sp. MACH09]|nr:hypothetical protein MACH09_41850 [Vibrio sp. MACH09]
MRCIYMTQGVTVNTKKKKEANKKDSQLIIRINGEQRDEFVSLCEDLDTSAAREVRRFIKHFIADNKKEEDE